MMDPRLLRSYNEELIYLRETAREFAAEHPSVAGRLGLDAAAEVDPHVERLLEGVAFLGARVQLKLQDQYGDFTQHLLSAIQPHYLAPTPSMCVVALEPREGDAALAEGVTVPRHSRMRGMAADRDATPVTFRTGEAVTLWPLQVLEAEYLPSRSAVAPFIAGHRDATVEAGLRLRFAATGGAKLEQVRPGRLPIYLDGAGATPGELYRQLIGDAVAVIAQPFTRPPTRRACSLPRPCRTASAKTRRCYRATSARSVDTACWASISPVPSGSCSSSSTAWMQHSPPAPGRTHATW
jgi:type VI protein secretion system component VasA